MPCISRFFGISIYMYHGDHNPPHFHAKYEGREAVVSIEDLNVVRGGLTRRALNLVIDWAELHREDLLENWRRSETAEQLLPIAPLE